jgi:hypothetical protein
VDIRNEETLAPTFLLPGCRSRQHAGQEQADESTQQITPKHDSALNHRVSQESRIALGQRFHRRGEGAFPAGRKQRLSFDTRTEIDPV